MRPASPNTGPYSGGIFVYLVRLNVHMQVTDGDDSNELAIEDLFSVLQMVEMEVAAGQSYEHIQVCMHA